VKRQFVNHMKRTIWEKILRNRQAILVFRLLLAALFLASAFGKFVNIRHYSVEVVYNFDVLPGLLATAFGWALPFIERVCALGLLFGILPRLCAFGTALLSGSFFVVKGILLSRGMDIDCGCFGALVHTMISFTIYLDLPIVLSSVGVLFSTYEARCWVAIGPRFPSTSPLLMVRSR